MLEINERNIQEVLDVKARDIQIRNKWLTGLKTSNVGIRLPKGHAERQEFIRDWLSVCPAGTNLKIKQYEEELKRMAKKRGAELPDWKLSVLIARKVAMIKKNYAAAQFDLMDRAAKRYNKRNIGYTYLNEIVVILDKHLEDSIKDFPILISNYEGKQTRKTV